MLDLFSSWWRRHVSRGRITHLSPMVTVEPLSHVLVRGGSRSWEGRRG